LGENMVDEVAVNAGVPVLKRTDVNETECQNRGSKDGVDLLR